RVDGASFNGSSCRLRGQEACSRSSSPASSDGLRTRRRSPKAGLAGLRRRSSAVAQPSAINALASSGLRSSTSPTCLRETFTPSSWSASFRISRTFIRSARRSNGNADIVACTNVDEVGRPRAAEGQRRWRQRRRVPRAKASLIVSGPTTDTDQSCAPHVNEKVCTPDDMDGPGALSRPSDASDPGHRLERQAAGLIRVRLDGGLLACNDAALSLLGGGPRPAILNTNLSDCL